MTSQSATPSPLEQHRTSSALRSILNRNFNVVLIINLLLMVAYFMIFISGTRYTLETYQTSLSTAGFSSSIMVIGCLIGRFTTSSLLSLFGCRIVLITGILLYSGSIAAFFTVPNLALLFVQKLLMGIGVGVAGTATSTLVAYVVPREHHGLGISLFAMSTALALAAGPFFGIAISEASGYHAVMGTGLSFGLVCLGVFFLLKNLPPMERRARPLGKLYSYIDPRVVRFTLVALLICPAYGCVQAFLTSFAAERGLSPDAAGLFFLTYAVTAFATRPLSGHLLDTRGENVVLYPVIAITALALTTLSFAHSSAMLLLGGCLMGIGFANFQSAGQAVSLSLVTRSRFAQATTTFFVLFDLGIGIGPYLFGFIVPVLGYDGMFQILACVVLCGAVLYHVVHGRKLR